jgi:serine/threonine-protein phosphatase CPPED1
MKRWAKFILSLLTALLVLALLVVTAIKIHSTWMLPAAPTNRNAAELKKIKDAGNSFRFVVLGDNKNSIGTFNHIRDSIEKQKPLFAIDAGDLVFDGERVKYRLFLNQVAHMEVPLITALGNHDREANGVAHYEEIFGPRYYSFVVANAYFIVLDDSDQKSVDPEQMKWFEKELMKGQAYDHRFVILHVPPYRGVRNPTMPMEEYLSDRKNAAAIKHLCVQGAIDYLFGSHMHTFDWDRWPWQVNVVITGGGGAELWDVDKYRNMHHYLMVTVDGDKVSYVVKPIKSPGSTFLYRWVDEPWTYFYAYVSNNYWLFAAPLLAALAIVIAGLALNSHLGSNIKCEL